MDYTPSRNGVCLVKDRHQRKTIFPEAWQWQGSFVRAIEDVAKLSLLK